MGAASTGTWLVLAGEMSRRAASPSQIPRLGAQVAVGKRCRGIVPRMGSNYQEARFLEARLFIDQKPEGRLVSKVVDVLVLSLPGLAKQIIQPI